MWNEVIDMLSETEALGEALPILCHRHPETVQFISEPQALHRFAPDGTRTSNVIVQVINLNIGGCLEPCDYALKCGHLCPYKVGSNRVSS
jgi:hypothetical protein